MRKGLVFWGAFLSGFALLALALVFMGREPEIRRLSAAIPAPPESAPSLYMEGEGKSLSFSLPPIPAEEKLEIRPFLKSLESLSPVLESAREAAVLVFRDERGLQLFFTAKYSRDILKSLSDGKIPTLWKERSPYLTLEKQNGPLFLLKGSFSPFPLTLSVDGGIVFIASSAENDLAMRSLLEKKSGGMKISWSVEDAWPNHFFLRDGGLASRLAVSEGLPVNPVQLEFTGAWREDEKGGKMKWSIAGLDTLLPSRILKMLRPVSWEDHFFVPDPFLAGFGGNIPEGVARRIGTTELKGWAGKIGIEDRMEHLLSGPLMASLGGSSKLFVFSLPGLLLQLPDRGDEGMSFVSSFWNQEWGLLVPSVEPLEGFSRGGTASIPFSLLGAARPDMVWMGILDGESLRPDRLKKLTEYIPVLKDPAGALFWMYLDTPRFSAALQNIARVGKSVESFGRTVGMDLREMTDAAAELSRLGKVLAVVFTPGTGMIEWENTPSPDKRTPVGEKP
ncbi:MAG: hypothetical protein GX791_07780 [Synergistaceae bacterium]|nr:hypothetical protein [Synergistaceae bacterium]